MGIYVMYNVAVYMNNMYFKIYFCLFYMKYNNLNKIVFKKSVSNTFTYFSFLPKKF